MHMTLNPCMDTLVRPRSTAAQATCAYIAVLISCMLWGCLSQSSPETSAEDSLHGSLVLMPIFNSLCSVRVDVQEHYNIPCVIGTMIIGMISCIK